jgi:urea-proton symporter
MKQKILVVDDRIRSIIEKDTNDKQLKRDAKFTYRYAIALSCTCGSLASSTLFFRICILIVCLFALGWLAGRFAWASIAAGVIILLPLIESRVGIIQYCYL